MLLSNSLVDTRDKGPPPRREEKSWSHLRDVETRNFVRFVARRMTFQRQCPPDDRYALDDDIVLRPTEKQSSRCCLERGPAISLVIAGRHMDGFSRGSRSGPWIHAWVAMTKERDAAMENERAISVGRSDAPVIRRGSARGKRADIGGEGGSRVGSMIQRGESAVYL